MALLPPLPGSVKAAPKGAPNPDEDTGGFLKPISAYAGPPAGPTPPQQAAALWAKTPGWQKPLLFVSQGLNDVGTGIDHLLGINTSGAAPTANFGRYAAPAPHPAAPGVNSALDAQHPGYNYLVKWPTELAASAPLGEAAGAGMGALMGKLGWAADATAPLWQRALSALPRSAAMGAAYGVQQPQGNPAVNATVGAITGPVFEGAASLAGKALGLGVEGAQSLYRRFFPRELTQPELDSVLAQRFVDQGLPTGVAPRTSVPGVELTTAVHSGDPRLMALQAAERIGGTGTPFYDVAASNNEAIVNGLQHHLAPQADSSAISTAAHDLLQRAQTRGKAAVKAAYEPFDAAKGGVYLERGPIQKALREAHDALLPAHQEMLPAKVREVLDADHPLHLTSDVEDLGARLSDAIGSAPRGTPAARALMMMRDALNKGVEDAPLANQAHPGALTYDPARNPLPRRNMAAPDPSQDSILEWLAKSPTGISSEEGAAQGLDPADMRGRLARVGIRRAFRQGGLSFDAAAQALHQAGYPVADAAGNYDPNALLNAIDSELRGRPVYSMANTRQAAEVAHDAATAIPPMREPPPVGDVAAMAERGGQVDPERTAAVMDGWTDDSPETLQRVRSELRAIAEGPRTLYRGERPGATPGHMNGGALWTTPDRAAAADNAAHQIGPQGLEGGAGPVHEYHVQLRKPYVLTSDKLPEFAKFFAPGEAESGGYLDMDGSAGDRPGLIGLSPTARENLLRQGYDSVIAHAEAVRPEGEPPSVVLLKSPRELAHGAPGSDATELWKNAKAAHKAFRDRFPQGTARDTDARAWLSKWLRGRKEPGRFLTEATLVPGRAKAVLDAFEDPAEREQMRRMLRNHYVNRLLSATREGVPGTRTLNAAALDRVRGNNASLERELLNPAERNLLDRYVQAAHDNSKILQRMHAGSSETAALRNYGKQRDSSVTEELLKHGASALHPAVGFLAHILPAIAKSPDNEAALQRTLTSALLSPEVYNRVTAAPTHIPTTLEQLLSGVAQPAHLLATRPATFVIPRGLGPALSGAR